MTTLAPLTVSGTTTSFLGFTTPFSVPPSASCASQIYSQAGTGGALIAFDPIYWASLVPSAPECIAQELTAWWFQNSVRTATTTVLAPFSCPEAYTTASTRAASGIGAKGEGEEGWKEVFCCPSSYAFQLSVKPGTIGQCISTMSAGSIFTLKTQNAAGAWVDAVSTVSSAPLQINAVHLNGFAFASQTATSTKSTQSTAAATLSAGSPTTTAATSTALPTSTDAPIAASQPLSAGASAGIGIGAALLVLLGALAAFLLWRRHSKKKKARAVEKDASSDMGFGFGGRGGMQQQQSAPKEMDASIRMSPQTPADRYAAGWNRMKAVEVGDGMGSGRVAELPTPVHELDGGAEGRMI